MHFPVARNRRGKATKKFVKRIIFIHAWRQPRINLTANMLGCTDVDYRCSMLCHQFSEVRQLEEFRDYMREIGMVDVWNDLGWPDRCEPAGDDFRCD